MSDMKCPICGSKISGFYGYGEELFSCSNLSCKAGGFYATDNMWQELIRTRKTLEIAVDVLKGIDKTRSVANHKIGTQDKILNSGNVFCWTTPDEIHNALVEITALEQKDVK